MSNITPGPWSVEPLQWDHGASIAIVANGQIICTIAPQNEADEPDMYTAKRGPHDEANASLIAAAPELLAVAKLTLDYLHGQEYLQAAEIIARAQNQ